ncbi:MAG: SEC-C domain-containing protein [Lachnospiraceae bacterium]|nr:SEC-C domain-containing protein [Lachnospiraceae bacterium]
MSILENWRKLAYETQRDNRNEQLFWANYFNHEKSFYEKILASSEVESGTVKALAEKYGVDVITMTGIIDGIDECLKEPNPIETMDEETVVSFDFDKEKLYKKMVECKAEWLYELPEWDALITPERRKELYKEQRSSTTIVKPKKIGRNDPCPCGSGKKFKACCLGKGIYD